MTSKRNAVTIALINNKGGVGKTTSAVALAAGLVAHGRRTLLVDLDAQGSASFSLGLTRSDLRPGTAEVLLEGLPILKAIRSTSCPGLDLLPGSMALASADLALADVRGREGVLKAALATVRGDPFDAVIVDCPPSLGLLTVNALTAADFYVVPMTPDYLALEGLISLTQAVERIRAGIGKSADLMGILMTMADRRMNVTEEIIHLIRKQYGKDVFRTVIPLNVKLKEAPSFGKTVFDYAKESSGALAYQGMTAEVLKRLSDPGRD